MTGRQSCFSNVSPEQYGTVGTIDDDASMRSFAEHLPSKMMGDFDVNADHANSGGVQHFEGALRVSMPWPPWLLGAAGLLLAHPDTPLLLVGTFNWSFADGHTAPR